MYIYNNRILSDEKTPSHINLSFFMRLLYQHRHDYLTEILEVSCTSK